MLSTSLRHKLAQSQRMAPQLQQSLHLLELGLPALREKIYEEMASNPLIESVSADLEGQTVSELEREKRDVDQSNDESYPDDEEQLPNSYYTEDADALERRRHFLDSITREETLEEHLRQQIITSDIAIKDRPLAFLLAGSLDSNGYFVGSLPDIIMASGETEAKIYSVLSQIRELDPPGCGALTLRDCLLAQLDQITSPSMRRDVQKLASSQLSNLAEGKLEEICSELKWSPERLARVVKALKTLNPRPGLEFASNREKTAYIHPEVQAVRRAGRWVAEVESKGVPEIHISDRYLKMLADPQTDKETLQYIREKVAAAHQIMDAIKNRAETIRRISQAIFDAQPGFFAEGLKGLKPLSKQEIADQVGVHYTTVARTVKEKYFSSPRGTFLLNDMFAQGVTTTSGEKVVKNDVFAALRELIHNEDKQNPLSDDALSTQLKTKGFQVARRTVAKYRDKLAIPGALARRVKEIAQAN